MSGPAVVAWLVLLLALEAFAVAAGTWWLIRRDPDSPPRTPTVCGPAPVADPRAGESRAGVSRWLGAVRSGAERVRKFLTRRLSPAGATGLTLTVGAALVLALGLGFAVLLDDVADGEGIAAVDRPVLAWLAAHRTPDLSAVITLITQLGSPVGVAVIAALVGGLISVRRRSWWALLISAVGAGGIGVINLAVKAVIGRPRPPNALAVTGEDGFSFPSGHTTAITVVGVLSAWMLTRWVLSGRAARAGVWTAAAILIVGVGSSRVYLGVHYPSDVLAGAALGAAWAVAVALAVVTGERARRAVAPPGAIAARRPETRAVPGTRAVPEQDVTR